MFKMIFGRFLHCKDTFFSLKLVSILWAYMYLVFHYTFTLWFSESLVIFACNSYYYSDWKKWFSDSFGLSVFTNWNSIIRKSIHLSRIYLLIHLLISVWTRRLSYSTTIKSHYGAQINPDLASGSPFKLASASFTRDHLILLVHICFWHKKCSKVHIVLFLHQTWS